MTCIREISHEESEKISELIQQSFADVAERFRFTRENSPNFLAYIDKKQIQDNFAHGVQYFFLEENGNVCGCVGMKMLRRCCSIHLLAVLPEYRRRGFGRQLVEFVCNEAKRVGKKGIILDLVARNVELFRWYRRLGFHKGNKVQRDGLSFSVRYMIKLFEE